MTKLRRMIQLLLTTQLSNSEIAQSVVISKTTVIRYRKIAIARKYSWEGLQALSEDALDCKFNKVSRRTIRRRMPDFAYIHDQMADPIVTLQGLWEDYCEVDPSDALSYSQYTEHYRRYCRRIDRRMRQPHLPGEKAFVDFSGRRPSFIDPATGERVTAELFVGVLGNSNLTFATCVPRQTLPYWISVHVDMFAFFGAVPKILVPDNLKSAITQPGPSFVTNRTYQEMAEHYGTAILPARPRKPRDKAKVEGGVLIVQRWILARIRHRQFFSLDELNAAVTALLIEFNERAFKKLPGNRNTRYREIERPAMLSLPDGPYEFGEWTGEVRVDNGYHVSVLGHWYSVPHHLVGEKVIARKTATTVEIFHKHIRVSSHRRDDLPGGLSTSPEHQPARHRSYAERTPDKYRSWGIGIGPATAAVVAAQLDRTVPALGFPACDGLRKLVEQHGAEEVEAAAQRAIEIQSCTVKSVRSLLSTQRHRRSREEEVPQGDLPVHPNVRGPGYYAQALEVSSC